MVRHALRLLDDPDAFFDRVGAAPRFRWPVAVVVVAGLLDVLDQVVVQQKLRSAMPAGSGIGQSLGVLLSVFTSVVQPLLAWLVLAAAFYAISSRLGGEGGFATTLKLVGWGFLPALLLSLLTTVVVFVVVGGAPTPSGPQDISTFLSAVRNNGYMTVTGYLPVAFTAWQGFVWAFAIKHARDLPLRDAAKAVAGPVALLVAWAAYVEVAGMPTFVLRVPFVGFFLGGGGMV